MSDSFTALTIVVYLNDAFDGGETRLAISAEPSAWLDIRADMGDAIVFRQEILHMGGEVVCGSKYILRCDTIYSTVSWLKSFFTASMPTPVLRAGDEGD